MSEVPLEHLVRGGHALAGRVKRIAASPRVRIAAMNAGTRLLFERRLRAQTEGWIELADLGLPSEHRIHYQPSPWLTLPRAIRRSEVSREDVFIDFGCGMGRMVLEAAILYPFDRVVGVELSEELTRIARANLDRNRRRLAAREVEVIASDVLDYQVPDDVTVAFFYNPFLGPIFEHVIRQLLASVDRAPRRVRIIYRNPVEEAMLLATRRIRRVGSGRSFTRRDNAQSGLALYEIDPA
jgi:predicted RNA methylase